MQHPTVEAQCAYFLSLLGEANVLIDAVSLATYGTDWTRRYTPQASIILRPKTTLEVAKILAYCQQHMLSVVPSGGRTGLAGGAVALNGEIVLSLERMNQILEVNTQEMWILAEAGVTLAALQAAAKQAEVLYPLDLASKGTCQLGGNIATNAGGLKFIRYGGMRHHVLGLEVVLADGRILDLNTSLEKDNTGYDLKQMFIGSEGTLGIITQGRIRLVKKPAPYFVCLVAVESFPDLLSVMEMCRSSVHTLTACEFFTEAAYRHVQACFSDLKGIFSSSHAFYGLIEVESLDEKSEHPLFPLIEAAYGQGVLSDAVFAETSEQFRRFWSVRENITESLSRRGQIHKNDLTLPLGSLGAFMEQVSQFACDDIELVFFGHLGDGNIHINYVGSVEMDRGHFQQKVRIIEKKVFALIQSYRGSISAEHGIGCIKREDLHHSRASMEIDLMRNMKKVFDPMGILNPGKIFFLLVFLCCFLCADKNLFAQRSFIVEKREGAAFSSVEEWGGEREGKTRIGEVVLGDGVGLPVALGVKKWKLKNETTWVLFFGDGGDIAQLSFFIRDVDAIFHALRVKESLRRKKYSKNLFKFFVLFSKQNGLSIGTEKIYKPMFAKIFSDFFLTPDNQKKWWQSKK